MTSQQITVLGVGNILLSDEGFGICIVEKLDQEYEFPANVSVVSGGVLGLNLIGIMIEADHLLIVDAIKYNENPGSLYRFEGDSILQRPWVHNSLHQVELPEVLDLVRALDMAPKIVILGVEPQDIETPGSELTPVIQSKVDQMTDMVLAELNRLGVFYHKRND